MAEDGSPSKQSITCGGLFLLVTHGLLGLKLSYQFAEVMPFRTEYNHLQSPEGSSAEGTNDVGWLSLKLPGGTVLTDHSK